MRQNKTITHPETSIIRPRLYLGPDLMVGPGKIALLKGVRDTGSISAAARQLGMSYKRAWYLLNTLNQGFRQPVVEATHGGRGGGGARLTALGEALLAHYATIEAACAAAAAPHLAALAALLPAAGPAAP
jgi:molybdate transport system regulatory protein